jgi:beta-phosphoglucomutase
MAFEGVLFDVDGVLVDSPHEQAWRQTFDELMTGPWSDIAAETRYATGLFDTRLYMQLVAGKPREAGARAVLDHFGVPDAERRAIMYAVDKQEKIRKLIEAGDFHAFPDAIRFAFAIRDQGIPMAVASSSRNANELLQRIVLREPSPNGPEDLDDKEPGATLLSLFSANVCGREFAHGKPHPDIFLAAASELGVDPKRCLVIEDATSGVLAAKAGGMTALGVARLGDEQMLRDAGADLVVQSLDEVDVPALAWSTLIRRRQAA